MEIVKRMAALANSLDTSGHPELADSVDKVMNGFVRTAQYVGPQGYWHRNQRCWANCYRQKRASNPEKPVNDVWWECQEEYQKALVKPSSSWDKYAESAGVAKFASDNKDHAKFAKALQNQIEQGTDASAAVFNFFNAGDEAIQKSVYNMAERMVAVGENLSGEQQKEAYAIAEGIIKEAVDWGKMVGNVGNWVADNTGAVGNFARGLGQSVMNGGIPGGVRGVAATGQLKGAVAALQQAHSGVGKSLQQFTAAMQRVEQTMSSLQGNKSPQVQNFAQKAMPILGKLKGFKLTDQYLQQTSELIRNLQQLTTGVIPDQVNGQQGQASQPTGQTAPQVAPQAGPVTEAQGEPSPPVNHPRNPDRPPLPPVVRQKQRPYVPNPPRQVKYKNLRDLQPASVKNRQLFTLS